MLLFALTVVPHSSPSAVTSSHRAGTTSSNGAFAVQQFCIHDSVDMSGGVPSSEVDKLCMLLAAQRAA